MFNEGDRFCLLENGDIEPLYYENHEPREIFHDDWGNSYLDHDVFVEKQKVTIQQRRRDRIIATSDCYWKLWEMKNEGQY